MNDNIPDVKMIAVSQVSHTLTKYNSNTTKYEDVIDTAPLITVLFTDNTILYYNTVQMIWRAPTTQPKQAYKNLLSQGRP